MPNVMLLTWKQADLCEFSRGRAASHRPARPARGSRPPQEAESRRGRSEAAQDALLHKQKYHRLASMQKTNKLSCFVALFWAKHTHCHDLCQLLHSVDLLLIYFQQISNKLLEYSFKVEHPLFYLIMEPNSVVVPCLSSSCFTFKALKMVRCKFNSFQRKQQQIF